MDFQSNYRQFQVFFQSEHFFSDLIMKAVYRVHVNSRGGYVNVENLYKSVFRQTRLEKHLEYDNPRPQTQKRAQIEYWGVTGTQRRGTDESSLFFVTIQ